MGPYNFRKLRVAASILNNITGSMTKDMGTSLRFLPKGRPDFQILKLGTWHLAELRDFPLNQFSRS
jgi:hypothetical protein